MALVVGVFWGMCTACVHSVPEAESSDVRSNVVVPTNVTAASEPPATNAASLNARRPRHREMYEIVPMSDEQRRLMRAQRAGKDLLYDPREFDEAKPTREAPASDIEVRIE
jgi:hypothetical protein